MRNTVAAITNRVEGAFYNGNNSIAIIDENSVAQFQSSNLTARAILVDYAPTVERKKVEGI